MTKEFILPDIGEGIVECEIVEWLVSEGEQISEDQPVADVMTDKALVQIPSMYSGTVEKLHYEKGDIAKVHEPLFSMSVDGEDSAAPAADTTAQVEQPAVEQTAAVATGSVVEDFILPDIGEGIVECEIVEWLVSEGEAIDEDQPVCDVMTDKALVQIPSKYKGTVQKLYYGKGDIAKVHQPLFAIEIEGSEAAAPVAAVPSSAPEKAESAPVAAKADVVDTTPVRQGKALASPAVRRFARENNIDIAGVPGSGKKGRVYKDDIVAFMNKGAATPVQTAAPVAAPVTTAGGTSTEAIRGIKAAMAKQMMASASTIPHFTYCEEIDMTNLVALRLQLKEKYAAQGVKLTMMPFFMKAMSLALKEFPVVNSQVNEECTEITYFDDHNIGMAVDSKVGLIVPNVKGCQTKSILDIANEVTRLTNDARDGRVNPDDIKQGTITISNIGALGGTVATPVINKPEVAIVALGKLQKLPRFNDDGSVEARQIMQVSWSGDHRVIDGGTIARFCNLWKEYLENPSAMLVSMI